MVGLSPRSIVKQVAFPILCLLLRIRESLRRERVIVYYKHPFFLRKSEALADLLRRRGFRTEVRSGMSFSTRALLRSSSDLWIGFWFGVPREFLPRKYILWNPEPLDRARDRTGVDAGWFTAMQRAQAVWGYHRSNADRSKKLGVPFHFVPFGYAAYYENIFRNHIEGKKLQHDIDVLFFGSMCERRQRMLDELKQRGMNVHVVSDRNPAYGETLDELLARAKIVLGIHYFEEPQRQIADLARVDHLLSNRLFVVHETPSALASDPAFEQNVTTCEYRAIPDICAHFLARPEERARKSAAAQEWFKSAYSLDGFIPYQEVQRLLRRRAGV